MALSCRRNVALRTKPSQTGDRAPVQQNWDVEADVVVVGFGAAGVAASVSAHDLGADVVILEKAPECEHGGNTRVAGQGYLNTTSAEDAAAYLTALCGPYAVPKAMVRVWAEEMCRNNQWLEGLGGDPKSISIRRSGSNSRICRDPTASTNSTMARPMAIPTPGNGSRAWSRSARSRSSLRPRAGN